MGKRLALVARVRRASSLRWCAAVAASLGADGFAAKPTCAAALLLPAVLCADDAVKGVAEEHRELAREGAGGDARDAAGG